MKLCQTEFLTFMVLSIFPCTGFQFNSCTTHISIFLENSCFRKLFRFLLLLFVILSCPLYIFNLCFLFHPTSFFTSIHHSFSSSFSLHQFLFHFSFPPSVISFLLTIPSLFPPLFFLPVKLLCSFTYFFHSCCALYKMCLYNLILSIFCRWLLSDYIKVRYVETSLWLS